MLRWNKVIFVALLAALLPLSAYADQVEIVGGSFKFFHDPVTAPDYLCDDPPAAHFSVTSTSFDGQLETKNSIIEIQEGEGSASGCVFDPPIDGVLAEFSGSFEWTIGGELLWGTIELLDFVSAEGFRFPAVIFLTFDGGTGRFRNAKGGAIAEGFDYPFGVIQPLPSFPAGVVAHIIGGEIKLKE